MSTDTNETERNDWVDAPDTRGRRVALRVVLIAVCLVAGGVIAHDSLTSPADLQDIPLVPSL
jgi:hypothetical protein